MPQPSGYVLVRVHDDSYRLERTDQPTPRAIAFIVRVRDRLATADVNGWLARIANAEA